MAQKIIGIDLGAHSVKLVVLSTGFRRTQVLQSLERTVARGPRMVKDAEGKDVQENSDPALDRLEHSLDAAIELMREHGFIDHKVAISVPAEWCSYRTVDLPFSDAKRIAQTLAFEIEGQFPKPIEELVFDHIKVGGRGSKSGRAMVIAIERTIVDRVARRFHGEVRAEIRSITSGAIALAQSHHKHALPKKKKAGHEGDGVVDASLVVDIGHHTTQLLAMGPRGPIAARSVRKGGELLTRRIAAGYQLEWEVAENAKHGDAFLPLPNQELNEAQKAAANLVAQSFSSLGREIEHTTRWLRSELGVSVVEIELTGGGSLVEGLDEWMMRQVGIDVIRAAPAGGLALRPADGPSWDGYLVALGAALGVARRPLISLYDPDGGDDEGGWLIEKVGTLSLIAALVLGFAGIDTVVKMQARDREIDFYTTQLKNLSEPVFGTALDSEDQVQQALGGGGDTAVAQSQVHRRGAFEVFAALVKLTVPSDAGEAEAEQPATKPTGAPFAPTPGAPFNLPTDPRTGQPYQPPGINFGPNGQHSPFGLPPGAVADSTGTPEVLAPVELDAGIVRDDALVFTVLDIRESKMELKMTATRATAQDRLAIKLEELDCIDRVQKGKIRDRNDRKQFEMVVDHHCFTSDFLEGGE